MEWSTIIAAAEQMMVKLRLLLVGRKSEEVELTTKALRLM